MAIYAVLDFGALHTIITASANGILASGSPTCKAASTLAFTIGIICGHASPTSSQAHTISLRHTDGKSPAAVSYTHLDVYKRQVLAIKFLMKYIKKHDFKIFGVYRILLGIAVIIYFSIVGTSV